MNDVIVKVVLFDFGGVIAEEGFREGLKTIARMSCLDEDIFFKTAEELIYESGYVTGKAPEELFWRRLREETGVSLSDEFMRNELMKRFIIRWWMIDIAKALKVNGLKTGILSDQTNWLDELNERYDFFRFFDDVFNSYHLGKGKRDAGIFDDTAGKLAVKPASILFVDDNPGHCARALNKGYRVINYERRGTFVSRLQEYVRW